MQLISRYCAVCCALACLLALRAAHAEGELQQKLRQLSSKDEAKRLEAGNWIAGNGREHIDELIELLPDHDPELCYGAALSLGLLGPAAAKGLPGLVDQLSNPDIGDVAIESIMVITDDWPEILRQLAGNKAPYSRRVGAHALGLCQHADVAIPLLRTLLQDSDPDVQVAACQALVWYPRDAGPAIPELRALLGNKAARVRNAALFCFEVLSSLVRRDSLPAIRALLQDPDPAVRSAAISALVKISPTDYSLVDDLTKLLEDADPAVRVTAAFSLSRFGSHSAPAVGKLTETLGRKLWYLAPYSSELATNNLWAPLEALGAIGEKAKPALPEIRKLLDDQFHGLDAAMAIRRISGDSTELTGKLRTELVSGDAQRVMDALDIAGQLGTEAQELLPELGKLQLDGQSLVRQAAAETLGKVAGDPKLVARSYAGMLATAKPEERLLLLNRLRDLGRDAEGASDEIIKLFSGRDDFELALAASTLYAVSGEVLPSRDVLVEVIGRDNDDAIAVAAHGLRVMGKYATDALPRLREIAADKHYSDSARSAAQRAVDEISGA